MAERCSFHCSRLAGHVALILFMWCCGLRLIFIVICCFEKGISANNSQNNKSQMTNIKDFDGFLSLEHKFSTRVSTLSKRSINQSLIHFPSMNRPTTPQTFLTYHAGKKRGYFSPKWLRAAGLRPSRGRSSLVKPPGEQRRDEFSVIIAEIWSTIYFQQRGTGWFVTDSYPYQCIVYMHAFSIWWHQVEHQQPRESLWPRGAAAAGQGPAKVWGRCVRQHDLCSPWGDFQAADSCLHLFFQAHPPALWPLVNTLSTYSCIYLQTSA